MKQPIGLLTLLFLSVGAPAQDLQFAIGFGGPDWEETDDVTTDNMGNVYCIGHMNVGFDFDPGPDTAMLEVEGTSALFIAKYNPDGNLIWAKAIQSLEGYSRGSCIVTDDSCNVYVAGYVQKRSDFDPSDEEYILNETRYTNIFLARYDSLCNLDWAFVITGSKNYPDVYSMQLDASNNILITGFVQKSIDFDPGPGTAMLDAYGLTGYYAKYSSEGEYIASGSIINADIYELVMDGDSNIYLAGNYYESADLDFDTSECMVVGNGEGNWFLARYDKDFKLKWGFGIGNNGQDHVEKLVILPDGKIVAGGFYSGSVQFDPEGLAEPVAAKGYNDIFLAAYNTNGSFEWVSSLGGSDADDLKGMAVDKEKKIVVSGNYQASIDVDPGEENVYLPLMGIADAFIAQYDTLGNYLAAYSLRGPGVKLINAMQVDWKDDVVITGRFDNSLDFDMSTEVFVVDKPGSSFDVFLAEYGLNSKEPVDTGQIIDNKDLVRDINPFAGSNPSYLYPFSHLLYFIADDGSHGKELWRTDGTLEGTELVTDINRSGDAFMGNPNFTGFRGDLYFIAQDSIHGKELWVSGDSTRMVKDLDPSGDGLDSSSSLVATDSMLYFTAKDSSAVGFWKTGGDDTTTDKVYDCTPYGDGIVSNLAMFRDQLYFFTSDSIHGTILWRSDGSAEGTGIFMEFGDASTYDRGDKIFVTDTILYFELCDSSYGKELWTTDGTPENTGILYDVNPGSASSDPENLMATDRFVFFTANDSIHGRELWETGGTPGTTLLVSDILSTGSGIPENGYGIVVDNEVYFSGMNDLFGLELWKSDGYDSTTQVLANINPGGNADPNSFCSYNSEIYFSAFNGDQWDLWRSRDNGVDVQPLRGLNPHGDVSPQWITYQGGIVYFVATDGNSGMELWKYKLIEDLEIEAEDSTVLNVSEKDSISYLGTVCLNCSGMKADKADTLRIEGLFYPRDATDTMMIWTVVEGKDLATVSTSGNLILNPGFSEQDTVTFRLETDDGSKLFRTISIIAQTMENGIHSVEAGSDVTINCGEQVQLRVDFQYVGNNAIRYQWSPSTGLDNDTVRKPMALPGSTTEYFVEVYDGAYSGVDSVQVIVLPADFGVMYTADVRNLSDAPYEFTFQNLTPDPDRYQFTWNFGDSIPILSNASDITFTYPDPGDYDVTLTAVLLGHEYCIDSLYNENYIFCGEDLGEELHHPGISGRPNIRPNPVTDGMTIEFPNQGGDRYSLYIMNLSGKICRIENNIRKSRVLVETGDLKRGMYLIELRGPKIYRGKFVVE